MLMTLHNDSLCLKVETTGAQMMSLSSADGLQYLWQGDPAYWSDRAPLLFPFIARLTEHSYLLSGKLFHMGIHGFASASEFDVSDSSPSRLVLTLENTPETFAQYPFLFRLDVSYELCGNSVSIACRVRNLSDTVMPFGIGAHPGFRVPLTENEKFEDYSLKFSCPCQPDRVGFTPQVFLSGCDTPYPLKNGQILPLRHDLFDDDAVILKNMAREVTLESSVSGRGVRVSYPDMPYLGIWHWPRTDAPYVCIEPWSSLPSRQDIVEEFTCKSDLIHLAPGKEYTTAWEIDVF